MSLCDDRVNDRRGARYVRYYPFYFIFYVRNYLMATVLSFFIESAGAGAFISVGGSAGCAFGTTDC